MSEYQYYEFRALDRRLSDEELSQLGRLSSRAEITPSRFVNTYNYGDFRGDPYKVMDKYFDVFLYAANWGTRRLMFRLPRRLIDLASVRPYCRGEEVILKTRKNHMLLEFFSEEDGDGWEEGEVWLDHLIEIREELLLGDYRSLMIAWLLGVQYEEYGESRRLPPIPPGMNDLSDPQSFLADFLRVDHALIQATGRLGGGDAPAGPSPDDYAAWLSKVPESEKNQFLLALLGGDELHVRSELMHRFQESQSSIKKPTKQRSAAFTVAQLHDQKK